MTTRNQSSRLAPRASPPFGTPRTTDVRLVAGIQNRLFWRAVDRDDVISVRWRLSGCYTQVTPACRL
jgi:hypothetical protein